MATNTNSSGMCEQCTLLLIHLSKFTIQDHTVVAVVVVVVVVVAEYRMIRF
jgi:hypothetical protein